MTQQELDALKALADAATPGPWEVEHHSGILVDGVPSTCAVLTSQEYDMASFGDDLQGYFDAAFIAAAASSAAWTAMPQAMMVSSSPSEWTCALPNWKVVPFS